MRYYREWGQRWKPPAIGGFYQCHALWERIFLHHPGHVIVLFLPHKHMQRDQGIILGLFACKQKKERSSDVERARSFYKRTSMLSLLMTVQVVASSMLV